MFDTRKAARSAMGGPGSGQRRTRTIPQGELLRDLTYADRGVPPPPPDPRREVAAAAVIAGVAQTVRQAMTGAGYAPSSSPDAVKVRVLEIAEEVGLTLRKVCETVAQGLDAEKVIEIGDERLSEPDTPSRLRAAEIGLRVHGVGQHDHGSSGAHITLVEVIYTPQATGPSQQQA